MHIAKVLWMHRNDFHFLAMCRHCGKTSRWIGTDIHGKLVAYCEECGERMGLSVPACWACRVCGVCDVAEQNALRIVSACVPEASACDTAGASAVIRIASNPMRLPNWRTRRRRMRLTLASKAGVQSLIMPRVDARVCACKATIQRSIGA